MTLRPRRGHEATWICSLTGHVAPAARAVALGPSDGGLGVDLADGSRVVRCLRCDLWLRLMPPGADDGSTAELDLAGRSLPLRDEALHDRIVLRAIALERVLHVVLFATAALIGLLVELRLRAVQGWSDDVLADLRTGLAQTGGGPSHDRLITELTRLAGLTRGSLHVFIGVTAAYAALQACEAVGLWRGRRWAEYLAVISTSAFLPIELRELFTDPTVPKVLMLALNLAIIVWLVRRKRLFGVAGGPEAAQSTPWAALIAAPLTPDIEHRLSVDPPSLPDPHGGP